MKKDQAKAEIIALMSVWQRKEFPNTPRDQLSSSSFYSWLEANSSGHLRFRTTTGVRYDIDMWFDKEFGQSWRN
jgi:hypothetical protein